MALVRWKGTAADITQVSTVTIANTWAGADTATLTINGNSVTITIGTGTTTAAVAEALAAAVNASDKVTGLESDETRNIGGQKIPEFTEVTAAWTSGSTFTVTANTPGKPFTMTATEATAGTGTCVIATTVAASGKNFWSTAANWDSGAVPANDDRIVIANSDVSILYGLPTALELKDSGGRPAIQIDQSFTGRLGLPIVNRDNTAQVYTEYRTRYPVFEEGNGASAFAMTVQIGAGPGTGSPMLNVSINIDHVDSSVDINVLNTGTPQNGLSKYALNLATDVTGNDYELNAMKGSIGVATDGELAELTTVRVGYTNSQASDVTLYIGFAAVGTITQNGGTVTRSTENATGTTLWVIHNGIAYLENAIASLEVYGGTAYIIGGGSSTDWDVGGSGVIDLSRGTAPVTIATLDLFRGATFRDPAQRSTFTAGIDLNECGLPGVTLDFGPHKRITLGSVA